MKKAIFIHLTIIFISLGTFLLVRQTILVKETPLHIAVAGPMSGHYMAKGKEMLKGINLYLNKINKAGGINGRKIKLRIFDDKNEIKTAKKTALEISRSDDILIVLGHYFSEISIAVGKIYKKGRVPAITGSATARSLTTENDWYFRTVPNNVFQGNFIANYINKGLKKNSVSVIFIKDSFGLDFLGHFENFAVDLGLEIKKKWGFDPDRKKLDDEMKKITEELKSVNDPGILLFVGGSYDGVKLISSLKKSGINYSLIGVDTLTEPSFYNGFNEYPLEQETPGYYTDGIYAISSFLVDIAGKNAYDFREEFFELYNEEPSWIAAFYYDAVQTVAEAIKRADIQDKEDIEDARRKIRAALAGMYNLEKAVDGITGHIYFDKNGDVNNPLAVGVYKKQKFIPAFSQYDIISGAKGTADTIRMVLNGNIILINGKMLKETQVVYTGIHINEVSGVDIKNAHYTADFYLWFRFQGKFKASDIEFINALKPLKLDQPMTEKSEGEFSIQLYHIKADFRSDFDFHNFPFDHQVLRICFRHAFRENSSLIFIHDLLKPPEFSDKKNNEKTRFGDMKWSIDEISLYKDIISNVSTLGIPDRFNSPRPINYSRFNAEIRIKRNDFTTVFKRILPIFIGLLGLYLIYFIPSDQHILRVLGVMFAFIANTFCHLKFLSDLPVEYIMIIEYVFFMGYALIMLSLLISVSTLMLQKGNRDKTVRIMLAGKIIHPLIVLTTGLWIAYIL
ncbi:ABC transporter substrate-binding protein [Desulfonema magnum]|uniref:Leucine binding domain-containing protein n=1 Tax=Desulfonema magnum TaxID=45655 RepID=A0A975GU98_9BACT|nr:ABC transporter substrate-binding protein [Desulfonema magnum]QTA93866.1 Leucine binding domain-containing protein [Desulfonema magnum]